MMKYGFALLLLSLMSFSAYAEGENTEENAPSTEMTESNGEMDDNDHSHIPLHHPKHPKFDEDHPENESVPPQKLRHYLATHPDHGSGESEPNEDAPSP